MSLPRLLTTAEAADYLGCGRQWISKLVADGRLTPVRTRPYLFTLADLMAAARAVKPVGRPPAVPVATPLSGDAPVPVG